VTTKNSLPAAGTPGDLVWGIRRQRDFLLRKATTTPVFLDRLAEKHDRVRLPATAGHPMTRIGVVKHFCTDPIDAGMVRCEVPGEPGLVRVARDSLLVLAGAR
jgi:hypothetical protein